MLSVRDEIVSCPHVSWYFLTEVYLQSMHGIGNFPERKKKRTTCTNYHTTKKFTETKKKKNCKVSLNAKTNLLLTTSPYLMEIVLFGNYIRVCVTYF